jgi:hypothetical protein
VARAKADQGGAGGDAAEKKVRFKTIRQIGQAYRVASRTDKRLGLYTFGSAGLVLAAAVLVGVLVGPVWFWVVVGLPLAFLVGTIIFGRRAEAAVYSQIEGQPGAAASALQTLRRGWVVEPAVAVNRQQDVVHRVLGKPGIVLVGEGSSPGRVRNLLAQEHRRHARIATDVAIHELVVGTGENEVPLRKTARAVQKLPKSLSPAQVTEVRNRLRAMPSGVNQMPIPKGPLPKNVKLPKGAMPPR